MAEPREPAEFTQLNLCDPSQIVTWAFQVCGDGKTKEVGEVAQYLAVCVRNTQRIDEKLSRLVEQGKDDPVVRERVAWLIPFLTEEK